MKKIFKIIIVFLCLFSFKIKAETIDKVSINAKIDSYGTELVTNVDYEIILNSDEELDDYTFYIMNIQSVNSSNYEYELGDNSITFKDIKEGNNVIEFNVSYKSLSGGDRIDFDLEGNYNYYVNIITNDKNVKVLDNIYNCEEDKFLKESDTNYFVNTNCNNGFHIVVQDYNYSINNGSIVISDGVNDPIIACIIIIIALGFLMYCYQEYLKKTKKNNNNINVIMKNHNSLEIGYIYNNCKELVGIESIIYELGSEGYLKIIEKNNELYASKIKDYKGIDKCKRIAFKYIFENGSEVKLKDVNLAKYEADFISEINKNRIIEFITNQRKRNVPLLMSIALNAFVALVIILSLFAINSDYSADIIAGVLLTTIFCACPISIFLQWMNLDLSEHRAFKKTKPLGLAILNFIFLSNVCIILFSSAKYTSIAMFVFFITISIEMLLIRKIKESDKNSIVNSESIYNYRTKYVNLTKESYKEEYKQNNKFMDKVLPYCIALDCFDIMSHNIPDMKCVSYFDVDGGFLEKVDDLNKYYQDLQKKTPYYGQFSTLKIILSLIIGLLLLFIALIVGALGFLLAFAFLFIISITLLYNSIRRLTEKYRK